MTRFWLVRHGPTHARAMIGWTDLPADLSDSAALERLAAHLPTGAPVISSDLSRAIATADALGARPRLAHDPALREMHFGQWETRAFAEIEAEDPTRIRAFGVAFILATGSAAGSFVPTISGALFDSYGMGGVFGLAAAMYAIFAICIRLGPETYGMSMEDITQRADTVSTGESLSAEPAKGGA